MILRPCVSMAGALLSVGCSGIVLGARKPLSTSRVRLFFGRRKPPRQGAALALRESLFRSEDARNRQGFVEVIERFKLGNENRRGHVEFINVATRFVTEFHVERDLEVYKMLFDLFPKGKYTPRSLVQAEFFHFPYHQHCGVRLLDTMESHDVQINSSFFQEPSYQRIVVHTNMRQYVTQDVRVLPDREMRQMVLDTFGFHSEVFKKLARMMYWMPKFKHMSPFPLPNPVPRDPYELAQLAIRRMCVDIQSIITVHRAKDEVPDAVDDTWVVSGQSPQQQELIELHPTDKPIRIEGPFSIYLRSSAISYFLLRAEPTPIRVVEIDSDDVSNIPVTVLDEKPDLLKPSTVHEQTDGIILAMAATGTSTRDSLLSWLRILQLQNPKLSDIPVVFMLKAPSKSLVTANHPQEEFESIAEDENSTDNECKANVSDTSARSYEANEADKTGWRHV
ncbi:evolutionarily conserved signaling intermediate in Toll pathway, mitochondrial isoform X2 [Rhipicephalus microplus]|uniref:evolutionarily conserved signaling intermediate in Toll pathway, mitochondrial isoform X2 n=1 Tax=Rhipicephalus microplus TaxID=6941 RepID=UPI00188783AD|nr:evolutionarily conserved signaling intermediate in Toll pathway, mitochondrial-like isoform X2 [Rhipicephalus microplus]